MDKDKVSRRRGEELLESLYNATITLAATNKLTSLTFQQIADEAKTSRTVLYRRWASPFDLLQDIYAYKTKKLFDADFLSQVQDNGTLRKDFFQLLSLYQKAYNEVGAEAINNYYYLRMQDKENSREPVIHIQAIEKYLSAVKAILNNAQSRGEKISKVSNVTLMLPFDLIRTENLIRPENISKKRLMTMVEEILIPVFTNN